MNTALLALFDKIDIDLILDLCIAFQFQIVDNTTWQVTEFLLFAVALRLESSLTGLSRGYCCLCLSLCLQELGLCRVQASCIGRYNGIDFVG